MFTLEIRVDQPKATSIVLRSYETIHEVGSVFSFLKKVFMWSVVSKYILDIFPLLSVHSFAHRRPFAAYTYQANFCAFAASLCLHLA